MSILWNTDVDAPGCPGEILEIGPKGEPTGRSVLVQTDWDYPGVASSFGWSTRNLVPDGQACDHNGTDGTVDCPECGITAGQFISAAGEWLRDNDGAMADDPGYFEAHV